MPKILVRLLTGMTVLAVVGLAITGSGVFSHAAPAKRPAPEPVWAAQIPAYGNLFPMQEGYLYKNGDPYVRVTVQKSTTAGVVTRSTIHFFIYANTNPPTPGALFQGMSLSDYSLGEAGPAGACGFPDGFGGGLPGCLESFFNSPQPKPGYEHLLFYFVVEADIEDLGTFPQGEEVHWTGSGADTIYFWNSFNPLSAADPEPYESVTARLTSLCSDGDKGIWIKRVGDTWEIRIEQQMFTVSQHYTWQETKIGKNGRPQTIVTSYQPLTGTGELSYKLRLIKNPS